MSKKDPRIDAYIARSADFAQPILKRIRKVVHAACPAVEEDMKWGMPHFMYKGMLCGMAGFKQHCNIHFWRAGELAREHKEFEAAAKTAMGLLTGIKSVKHLPPDKTLAKFVKAAAALNDAGKRPPRAKKPKSQSQKSRPTSWPRSRKARRPTRRSPRSAPAINANLSNGSRAPSATKPASAASSRPSNLSRPKNRAIGSTKRSSTRHTLIGELQLGIAETYVARDNVP